MCDRQDGVSKTRLRVEAVLDDSVAELLRRAGTAALASSASATVERKSDGSVVTDADRRAEATIVEGLMRLYPGDGIIGEEGSQVEGSTGADWYVDPLDGTAAFLEGLAYWGPTVCRVVSGCYESGWLYLPRLNEQYCAQRGAGAWLDGRRLRAGDTTVDGDTPLCLPSRYHRRMPIAWPGRVRAVGSTACHLALVARGSAAAAIIPGYKPWDVGCGVLLVTEAGRLVESVCGQAIAGPQTGSPLPVVAGAPTPLRMLQDGLLRSGASRPATQRRTE
jgi:myo-inositol-1(or 4)-monophosphatase